MSSHSMTIASWKLRGMAVRANVYASTDNGAESVKPGRELTRLKFAGIHAGAAGNRFPYS